MFVYNQEYYYDFIILSNQINHYLIYLYIYFVKIIIMVFSGKLHSKVNSIVNLQPHLPSVTHYESNVDLSYLAFAVKPA